MLFFNGFENNLLRVNNKFTSARRLCRFKLTLLDVKSRAAIDVDYPAPAAAEVGDDSGGVGQLSLEVVRIAYDDAVSVVIDEEYTEFVRAVDKRDVFCHRAVGKYLQRSERIVIAAVALKAELLSDDRAAYAGKAYAQQVGMTVLHQILVRDYLEHTQRVGEDVVFTVECEIICRLLLGHGKLYDRRRRMPHRDGADVRKALRYFLFDRRAADRIRILSGLDAGGIDYSPVVVH